MIFFLWIALTFVVAFLGSERKIGGFTAFFLSLVLSPLIGILIVLTSTKLSEEQFQKELLQAQTKEVPEVETASEIEKYHDLLQKGIISQEEFDKKKAKILGIN
jgi:uncharacterized membrane protein